MWQGGGDIFQAAGTARAKVWRNCGVTKLFGGLGAGVMGGKRGEPALCPHPQVSEASGARGQSGGSLQGSDGV